MVRESLLLFPFSLQIGLLLRRICIHRHHLQLQRLLIIEQGAEEVIGDRYQDLQATLRYPLQNRGYSHRSTAFRIGTPDLLRPRLAKPQCLSTAQHNRLHKQRTRLQGLPRLATIPPAS